MKDNRMIKALIVIVCLIMVDTITFVIVKDFTTSRIINIVFLNFAVIIPALILFINTKSKENTFLNYTKYPIAVKYGIITLVMSAVLMIIAKNNVAITVVCQVLVTGCFCLFMLTNKMANNTTEAVEEVKVKKMSDTRKFVTELNDILQVTKDRDLYRIVEKAYDGARSLKVNIEGDPTEIDNEIMKNITTLQVYASDNNMEKSSEVVDRLLNNFYNRNKL